MVAIGGFHGIMCSKVVCMTTIYTYNYEHFEGWFCAVLARSGAGHICIVCSTTKKHCKCVL